MKNISEVALRRLIPAAIALLGLSFVLLMLLVVRPQIETTLIDQAKFNLRTMLGQFQSSAQRLIRQNDLIGLQSEVSYSGASDLVKTITIFDPDGIVMASDQIVLVGKTLINTDVHLSQDLLEKVKKANRISLIASNFEGTIYGIAPFDFIDTNESVFQIRHGLIVLEFDLNQSVLHTMSIINQILIGISVLILLMSGFLWFFVGSEIALRLNKILVVTNAVAKGDFSQRLNLKGDDELTAIAAAVDRMTENLGVLYNRLEEEKLRAERSAEAKEVFLANMSHELRTPMNGVLGILQLLEHSALSIESRLLVDKAISSSTAMITIMNDILDMSKLDAGAIQPHLNSETIASVFDTAHRLFSLGAEQKGLVLSFSIDDDLHGAYFLLDAFRVGQILHNFISNAIKFTSSGYVKVQAQSMVGHDDIEHIKFSVTDSGIGISREDQSKLFQRFSQVDESITRQYGGTGLGLSISKKLVELMGGEIGIDNEKADGSCFWFTLPVERSVPPENESSDAQASHPVVELSFNLRILLVEDIDTNRMVAQKMLEHLGCTVLIAENGQQAIEVFSESDVDLIFMDIHMPIMDGITATKAIRLMERGKDIPIIALTAAGLESDLTNALESGMDDFVTKPLFKKNLEQALIDFS